MQCQILFSWKNKKNTSDIFKPHAKPLVVLSRRKNTLFSRIKNGHYHYHYCYYHSHQNTLCVLSKITVILMQLHNTVLMEK